MRGSFLQADLMKLPEQLSQFDLIFSEGVLHHTDSVADSISALSARLAEGGGIRVLRVSR